METQEVEFRKYSPEQQLEIYLHAVQGVEPPATQFGDFLAANGRRVLPPLLAKLREESGDRLKAYLVDVFYKMHREHCSLKDDVEVIVTSITQICFRRPVQYNTVSQLPARLSQNVKTEFKPLMSGHWPTPDLRKNFVDNSRAQN